MPSSSVGGGESVDVLVILFRRLVRENAATVRKQETGDRTSRNLDWALW
jgi:hypothetical protein